MSIACSQGLSGDCECLWRGNTRTLQGLGSQNSMIPKPGTWQNPPGLGRGSATPEHTNKELQRAACLLPQLFPFFLGSSHSKSMTFWPYIAWLRRILWKAAARWDCRPGDYSESRLPPTRQKKPLAEMGPAHLPFPHFHSTPQCSLTFSELETVCLKV